MARDLNDLLSRLQAYLPYGARITGVRQMAYGLSNGTYLLEGVNRILRTPPDEAGLLPPYDLARQAEIYRRVGITPGAPPVPRILDFCEDESVIGVPFYVMERIGGESFDRHNLPGWLDDPGARARLSQSWVETMAAVHRLPPETLPGPREDMAAQAAHWLGVAKEIEAPAVVRALLERFSAEPPVATGPAAPVHGDPNLTNLLWNGPEVVALLDWELSSIGEPFADIAFLLTFVRDEGEPEGWGIGGEGWWSKPQFVRHWESQTGRRVTHWRHHELLAMARLATILSIGDGLVRDGKKSDPRVAEFAEKVPRMVARIERRAERMDIDD